MLNNLAGAVSPDKCAAERNKVVSGVGVVLKGVILASFFFRS